MATLLSLGGSWSSAASWALGDATAESDSEAANTAIPTTVAYSSNFTWASAAPTVDGVAIKFATRAASPSGTVTVVLRNTTANSDVRTVTINASDLDASGLGWHFFKFASSVALSNSTNYAVGVSSSVAAQGNLFVTATNNWSRQLRTTATQVPAANDKVIVAGELTGAGTSNALTVTLDGDQSAVSLGTTALLQSVHVSKLGTLSYSTVAAANPKLKWKGIFGVYGGGTLNVGTSGTAIPSGSTAELIMDCAANVDSGLVINNGAVVNFYGNPITNVRANLGNAWAATPPSGSFTGTCSTNSTTAVVGLTGTSFVGVTTIWIAGVLYTVASVTDSTHLTTTVAVPTYASASYVVFPGGTSPVTGDVGGYCNTSGTAVTRLQGQGFTGLTGYIQINGTTYPISSVTDNDHLVLTITAGAQSSVNYVPSTNLITNTDDWTLTNATLLKSAATAQNGASNAALVSNNATSGNHLFNSGSVNFVTSTQYTVSAYIKYSNHQWIALRSDATSAKFASFDVLNGVVGAVSASSTSAITSIGSGWYRISLTWTASSTVASSVILSLNNADTASAASYAGTGTAVYVWGPMLNTGSSPGTYQTALTTDISTGWKSGDLIALASTSRTFTDCEYGALAADASGTSCTIAMSLVKPHCHMGEFNISGMNCEILNLSRNIKIHGNSGSLQGYIVINSTAVVTMRYAEFYWLGSATTNKRGLDIATTTGTFDCQYCALHDFIVTSSQGFRVSGVSGQTASTLILSNNNTFNIDERHVSISATSGSWMANNNVLMRNTSSVPVVELADVGGTFTNNVCSAGPNSAINLSEVNILGTFSGNVCHSTASQLIVTSGLLTSLLSNIILWRAASQGIVLSGHRSVTLSSFTLVGNVGAFAFVGNTGLLLTGCSSSGDLVFSGGGSGGNSTNISHGGVLTLESCSLGLIAGMRTSHTNADLVISSGSMIQVMALNTSLNSATQTTFTSTVVPGSFITAQRLNGVAGNHKFWMPYGTGAVDTAIFKAASPSLRLTPSNASNKLESAPPGGYGMKAAVANGGTITASVWVRKSRTSDASGTRYNGNQQRLILRKNVAAGIASDTVLATAVWTDLNVLSYAEQFDSAAGWTKNQATVTADVTTAPDGTTTADKLVEDASTNNHWLQQLVPLTASTTYTVSVYAKAAERSWVRLRALRLDGSASAAWFDLTNGVVGATPANTTATAITSVGNGWYRCSMTYTSQTGAGSCDVELFVTNADNTANYAGNGSSGIYIWGAMLNTGSTAGTYQPGSSNTWEQLTGTTAAVTDDAVLEFIVDCDGTAGWSSVDDWAISTTLSQMGEQYWSSGIPASGLSVVGLIPARSFTGF